MNRDEIVNLLKKNDILSQKSKFSPLCVTILKRIEEKKINTIKNSLFEIQDEGSQIVTTLSGARSGMKSFRLLCRKRNKKL